jgi:hypothetical protein
MTMRRALLLLPLTLAACGAANGPTTPKANPSTTASEAIPELCGAGKLGSYLGSPSTREVLAAIGKVAGERRIRVIRPGDAVTMDYSETRLNVEIGEDGRIKQFRCG